MKRPTGSGDRAYLGAVKGKSKRQIRRSILVDHAKRFPLRMKSRTRVTRRVERLHNLPFTFPTFPTRRSNEINAKRENSLSLAR